MDETLDGVKKTLTYHLKTFIELSDETAAVLNSHTKTITDVRAANLRQKIDDVNKLQIRVTILAPMKAGKSTILNAIVGEEVLPIHDEAMTALPTEIVLQYGNEQDAVNEPCLRLTKRCREILKELQEWVRTALNHKYKDLNSLNEQLNFNSHLIVTAQEILMQSNIIDCTVEETLGSENIKKLLHYINDLIHIIMYLHPSNISDGDAQGPDILLAEFYHHIPSVEIIGKSSETNSLPFGSSTGSSPYSLVLVDTPGPNEEATSIQLKEVINQELNKADIVLVVLDYTALGTEVDAKIAKAVRAVHHVKDPNYVYAVVNKVDQRQDNGKSEEDVKKHISEKYKIREENVFELKARYGLVGNTFLAARNNSLKSKELLYVQQSPVARNVLRQFYPMDFENRLQKIELAELDECATQLYKMSGIPQLLTNAIENIKGEVIRRCIESAFRIGYNVSNDLQQDIRVRREHLNQRTKDLKIELKHLHRDQKAARDVKENFNHGTTIRDILANFDNKLQSIFTEVQFETNDEAKYLLSEKNKRWLDPTKWRPYLYTHRLRAVLSLGAAGTTIAGATLMFVSAVNGVGIAAAGIVAIGVYIHSSGLIEFDKYDDVRKFIDYVIDNAYAISERSYRKVSDQLHDMANEALQDVQRLCTRQIRDIIGNAEQRFNRTLEFPHCNTPAFELHLEHIPQSRISVSTGYRPFFGLVPFTLSCDRDTRRHTRFLVTRQELQDEYEKVIKTNMDMIMEEINEHIRTAMKEIISGQFKELDRFLRKYEEDIKDCIMQCEHKQEDLEKVKQQLDSLEPRVSDEGKSFDEFCKTVKMNVINKKAN